MPRSPCPSTRAPRVDSVAEGLFPTESVSTQTSFKLTHRLTDSHELMARYAFSSAHIDREVLGADNFSEQSARGSSRNRDQSFAAGWQAVSGPSFVNELRIQFARRSLELTPNSQGALLEIPGLVSFGQSAVLDSSRTEDHVQVVESATFVRGAHQFGFGASLQHVTLDARLRRPLRRGLPLPHAQRIHERHARRFPSGLR